MESVVLWIGEIQNCSNLVGNFPQFILPEGNSHKGILLSSPPDLSRYLPKYFPHTVEVFIQNRGVAEANFPSWNQIFGGSFVTPLLTPAVSNTDPRWAGVEILKLEAFTLYFSEA